jgi:translation initiation factor 4B
MPKERPRLKLLPRSSGSNSTDPAPAPAEHHASIFGGAKPVDTSAREREIEERLRREAEEKQARLLQERESRDKDRDRDRDHGDRERGPRKDRMQLGAAEREGGYESHEDDDGRPR